MQTPSPLHIETLLQQAAAHPALIPEVLRVLMPLQIIMLGHRFNDAAHRTCTEVLGSVLNGVHVLPVFTSREELRAANLEHAPCLVTSFADYLNVTRKFDPHCPIVVNLSSPSACVLFPEQLAAFLHATESAAPVSSSSPLLPTSNVTAAGTMRVDNGSGPLEKLPSPQQVQRLLRQAVADPATVPEVLRVLATLQVIVVAEHVTDAAHIHWMKLWGFRHEGRPVFPCFTSDKALCTSGFRLMPCLTAPFTKFLIEVRKSGDPVVVDWGSPSVWTILPEQMTALSTVPLAAPCGTRLN